MKTFQYTVKDEVGLHARPAGLLVKCAASCTSEVTMEVRGKKASAKRLFGVMGLGVKQNDVITFSVSGPDEEADSAKIEDFCKQNF